MKLPTFIDWLSVKEFMEYVKSHHVEMNNWQFLKSVQYFSVKLMLFPLCMYVMYDDVV